MNYYSFFIVLAVCLLIYASKRLVHHIVDHEFFWKLSFYTTFSSLIGAKIFHIAENYMFYSVTPNLIFSSYGFSVLGAIVFGYLTIMILSIIYKAKFYHLTDRIFLIVPLAQFIGRIGNIANKELLPYSFYEMILNLINFGVLLLISRMKQADGIVTALFFFNYGVIRFFIEYTKGNYLGFLSLVSLIFVIYGGFKIFRLKTRL